MGEGEVRHRKKKSQISPYPSSHHKNSHKDESKTKKAKQGYNFSVITLYLFAISPRFTHSFMATNFCTDSVAWTQDKQL